MMMMMMMVVVVMMMMATINFKGKKYNIYTINMNIKQAFQQL